MNKPTVLLALWVLAVFPAGAADNETGTARADRLLDAMGGSTAWAGTRIVIVEATHYNLTAPTHYANRIVNDFTRPRALFEAHAPGWDRWATIDGATGYSRRDHEAVVPRKAEAIARDQAWWAANIYRTLHRLASGDTALAARAVGKDRLEIHEGETRLCWFRLNADGAPVLYGTGDEADATIFGPLHEAPNGVRYPSWGAGDLGALRYQVDRFIANPEVSGQDFTIPAPSHP